MNPIESSNADRAENASSCSSYELDCFSKPWPLVFSSNYDIRHWLTRFHPFDTKKWGRTFSLLREKFDTLYDQSCYEPTEITDEELLSVHTERYLDSLKSPKVVARVTEVPPVACLFKSTVKKKLLRPLRYQTDAHQGNGYARDFMGDKRIYILDVYNQEIYPRDRHAKKAIDRCVELTSGTRDDIYLRKVRSHVNQALDEFHPDVVLYNAGTDILKNDPLGCLSISPEGVIERDQVVFEACRRPSNGRSPVNIFMTTSGGYQRSNASVIANSIENLIKKNLTN